MALTPEEIQQRVEAAGRLLQEIQDALGRNGEGGRVRFPAGYIQAVGVRTLQFLWIGDEALKRNACYHLIFADVLHWLLNRTTLWLIARDMVIKHFIATMAAVAEALTIAACRRLRLDVGAFDPRVDRLVRSRAITHDTGVELKWLWETRTNLHIHEGVGLKIDRYPDDDAMRAKRALRSMRDELNERFIE